MPRQARTTLGILALAALLLLACQTTDLIGGLARGNVSSKSPNGANTPVPGRVTRIPQETRDPNADYAFIPSSTPRCTVGDNAASVVSGRIMQDGGPVEGQKVQASSGEGGEPISEVPAETDANGNYQVTFICDGRACDASFWIWLIDDEGNQISPFVKFVFDNQCRRGTLNFRNP